LADFEYIIVGSGAGGGPLAANLARRGFTVLLLEAGGDPSGTSEMGRLMYEVPIFHGLSTEFEECAWDYFVRHYNSDEIQKRDSKYDAQGNGIWYPRAGTLGGCTAHNAMITVTPQAMDWDWIARTTGDWSWRAEKMYPYFERLENCHYAPRPGTFKYTFDRWLWSFLSFVRRSPDPKGMLNWHGFQGWLTTSEADPTLALKDDAIVKLLWNTVNVVLNQKVGSLFSRSLTKFDPNDIRNSEDSPEGLAFTPLAVANGRRNGPREHLLRTREEYPNNLNIQLHSLVTKVLFEGNAAIGVEFLEGKHLYEADPRSGRTPPSYTRHQVRARREVILAAGAFNTPQILKLSGVGPAEELARHGIPLQVNLPGVGENLQDRYEVGVISEFPKNFELLQGASFAPPVDGQEDPAFTEWQKGKGLYTSNGSLLGILKRSSPELPEPDLYIFGLPGYFPGYKRGYSKQLEQFRNRFTWAILKAYTNNRAGRVTLRSSDPTKSPQIDFRYFSEGNDELGSDLDAVVKGVEFVRAMNEKLGKSTEIWPGPSCDGEKLREFIRNEAWGHHASCTAKIGAQSDAMSVLDSRFRVRGTRNLRVVDASVFPKIPGYFIVTPVYMISEKATDVIAEDASTVGIGRPKGEVAEAKKSPKRGHQIDQPRRANAE
jgi:choline dehydrogenase